MDLPTPSSEQDGALESGVMNAELPAMEIACVPARDEADELVAMMLAQLLQQSGFSARPIPIGTVADMLTQVSDPDLRVVCVSALPPSAFGQARSLCRRLRTRSPKLRIILCLWNSNDGTKVQERLGSEWADAVCTTLAEGLAQARLALVSVTSIEITAPAATTSGSGLF